MFGFPTEQYQIVASFRLINVHQTLIVMDVLSLFSKKYCPMMPQATQTVGALVSVGSRMGFLSTEYVNFAY